MFLTSSTLYSSIGNLIWFLVIYSQISIKNPGGGGGEEEDIRQRSTKET